MTASPLKKITPVASCNTKETTTSKARAAKAGLALFAAGYFINQQSDHILLNLRKPGETGYRVPHGGLYRYVSCPNYLGELIEWSGFALLTWSPGALMFVIWTAANLVPRARTHHAWYKERFPDYPPERRAILPWLI